MDPSRHRPATHRVDLHVRSLASNGPDGATPDAWSLPESCSHPRVLLDLLRERGMSLATLTDRDSLDGVRRLRDLADGREVFLSAQLTARFPDDGVQLPVTVLNLDEALFAELMALRRNVREFAARVHELGHPARGAHRVAAFVPDLLANRRNRSYGQRGALSIAHIEQALLLFEAFEVHSGARPVRHNALARQLVTALDPARIEELADRHGLLPLGTEPWRKALVGGSSDHTGLHAGRAWTTFPQLRTSTELPLSQQLVSAIHDRATDTGGQHGSAVSMAHAKAHLLLEMNRATGSDGPQIGPRVRLGRPAEALLRLALEPATLRRGEKLVFKSAALLQRLTRGHVPGIGPNAGRMDRALASEALTLLADKAFRRELDALTDGDERTWRLVGTLVDRLFARMLRRLTASRRRNPAALLHEVVGLSTSGLLLTAPYAISFVRQGADARLLRDVRERFDLQAEDRLALVTDTFFDVNGVARTIRRMIGEARRRGIPFTVVTALSAEEQAEHLQDPEVREWLTTGSLQVFTSPGNLDLPEYDGLKIRFVPILELLRFLADGGFTRMQISTPGTVGLTGLLAAKTLQIETSSTYHTSFPEYVGKYTGDLTLEELTWRFMLQVYDAVDEVVVPSRFVGNQLRERGLRNQRMLVLDRWVDTARFDPRLRSPEYWTRRGVPDAERVVKFVYVGRVGLEKNLQLVAEAYRGLRAERGDCHLIVIGDGPYRATMERELADLPTTFTGFLGGEELSRAIASADVKLFPSATDTWGNAPLEAQASGLPVIVSDQGGPQELMEPDVTGFRIPVHESGPLLDAMRRLMEPSLRTTMGAAARRFAEAGRVDAPFSAILDPTSLRPHVARPTLPTHRSATRVAAPTAC